MKILLAEDDPISADILQTYLEKWGHEVVAAENGADAWKCFEQENITMVISDWMMPEMDGLELVRRIRSSGRAGYVYIILLTAKTKKEDLVQGMEAGADDFLSKPFDREELRVRLRAGERIVELEQQVAQSNQELREANGRMKRDLVAAANVQKALLPEALPESSSVRMAYDFQPCEELAGDILGAFWLDDENLAVYLLDVSGHGVAASLLSVTVSHFLSPKASSTSLLFREGSNGYDIVAPREVANQLNRRFPMDLNTGQYFTLVYGIINRQQQEFRYVCAGHPGPIHLRRNAEPSIIKGTGFPIGIMDEDYEDASIRFEPGDRLFMYSDGITEASSEAGEQFGVNRLVVALQANFDKPLRRSLTGLSQHVEQWRGSEILQDDVSVLAVELC